MKIFIINLAKNKERLNACGAELSRHGLVYERFSAVNGKELSEAELSEKYDSLNAYRLNGRELSSGELGCALSHIGIYQKIVTENIPYALILEDDAYVLPPLKLAIEAFEKTISPQDSIVALLGEGGASENIIQKNRIFLPFSVYALDRINYAVRTHAYIITLEAAKRMLKLTLPVITPIDSWGRFVKFGVIKFYTISPLVVGLDCSSESTITDWGATPIKRSFLKKWTRRIWRYYWLKKDNFDAMIYRKKFR